MTNELNLSDPDDDWRRLIETQQKAAEIMRTLGNNAVSGAEYIAQAEKNLYYSAEQADKAIAERRKQDRQLVTTFLDSLPLGTSSNTALIDRHTVQSPSLQELKLAESVLWQTPFQQRVWESKPTRGGEIGYVIGSKVVPQTSQTERYHELDIMVAYRKRKDGSESWALGSYRVLKLMFETAQVLAQKRLAESITPETIARYLSEDKQYYQLQYASQYDLRDDPAKRSLLTLKNMYDFGVRPYAPPMSGVRHRHFDAEKAENRLRQRGLICSEARDKTDFDETDILTYNIDIGCFALATLFKQKQTFLETFSQLSTAPMSGLITALIRARSNQEKPAQ